MMTYGFISALFLVFNTHKYVFRNEKKHKLHTSGEINYHFVSRYHL